MNRIVKYADFVDDNWEEIVDYIDKQFESQKEMIQDAFLNRIKGFLTPIPAHFKLIDDIDVYEDYKRSNRKKTSNRQLTVGQDYLARYRNIGAEIANKKRKRIEKDGKISLNQTIQEFLEKEYTGQIEECGENREPYYVTYGNLLDDFSMDISYKVFRKSLLEYIGCRFDITISEQEYDDIVFLSEKINYIFGKCKIKEFMYSEVAVLYLDIYNIKLSEIDTISKYAKYVAQNWKDICAYLNNEFEKQKEDIKAGFLKKIKGYLTPLPNHYDFEDSQEFPEIDGKITVNQTLKQFLENECVNPEKIGVSTINAGFISYEDALDEYSLDISEAFIQEKICKYIGRHFQVAIMTDEYDIIIELSNKLEEIYDNCIIAFFVNCSNAIRILEIENTMLTDIVK